MAETHFGFLRYNTFLDTANTVICYFDPLQVLKNAGTN